MSNLNLHVTRDGIHTHLALPAETLFGVIPELRQYFEDCQWIRVGWGDYHYYGAEHQPLWLGLRALFVPTSSVVGLWVLMICVKHLVKQLRYTAYQ